MCKCCLQLANHRLLSILLSFIVPGSDIFVINFLVAELYNKYKELLAIWIVNILKIKMI